MLASGGGAISFKKKLPVELQRRDGGVFKGLGNKQT